MDSTTAPTAFQQAVLARFLAGGGAPPAAAMTAAASDVACVAADPLERLAELEKEAHDLRAEVDVLKDKNTALTGASYAAFNELHTTMMALFAEQQRVMAQLADMVGGLTRQVSNLTEHLVKVEERFEDHVHLAKEGSASSMRHTTPPIYPLAASGEEGAGGDDQ